MKKTDSWERTQLLLRQAYDPILKEEVPEHLKRLLDQLK
jgi:hypothetical protein